VAAIEKKNQYKIFDLGAEERHLALLLNAFAEAGELGMQVDHHFVPEHRKAFVAQMRRCRGAGCTHARLRATSSSFSLAARNTMSSASV
jgi:hypothetical protein